jgi:hypothetical protein
LAADSESAAELTQPLPVPLEQSIEEAAAAGVGDGLEDRIHA